MGCVGSGWDSAISLRGRSAPRRGTIDDEDAGHQGAGPKGIVAFDALETGSFLSPARGTAAFS